MMDMANQQAGPSVTRLQQELEGHRALVDKLTVRARAAIS